MRGSLGGLEATIRASLIVGFRAAATTPGFGRGLFRSVGFIMSGWSSGSLRVRILSVPDAFRESLPPWLCESSAGDEDADVVVSADRIDDVDYGDEDHFSDHAVDGHSGKVKDAYSDFEESDAGEG